MKGGVQRIKIARKGTANSSTSKDKEQSVEEKMERLKELKQKIEKDRQSMRKTGRRFNTITQTNGSTHEISQRQSIKKIEPPKNNSTAKAFSKKDGKVVEVSVGGQQPIAFNNLQDSKTTAVIKEKINLKQLVVDDKPSIMEGSRLFSRELVEQKARNTQVSNFLAGIRLQQFAEGLINMGYDDLQVLVQIKSEELNFLMMRAHHQKILLEALEQYKRSNGMESSSKQEAIANKPSFIKTKTKMNYKRRQEKREQSPSYRPKTTITEASVPSTNFSNSRLQNNSSLFSNPSFFYSIGANDWSMESLTRRACSSCFKVVDATELMKVKDCYYCMKCKDKESDMSEISLTLSMIRNYKI